MELNSFKELLLKKAEGNDNLSTLIRFISNEALAEEIIESLEKMAAHKGDKANSAITSWAGSATGADVNMLHDALSHHLSKFAAANKARPPKVTDVTKKISMTSHEGGQHTKEMPFDTKHTEMDPVAGQHLERAMHLADLAARASKHSLGKLNFDHVPTHAWEMNETSAHQRVNQHGQKKYADDQQGLKRRLQNKDSKDPQKRFTNYGYLMMNPHDSYANKGKLRGHQGQYPFEEMKVNDKHVHIDQDTPASDKYEPHPFDSHPLFGKEGKDAAWERSESNRSDADREKYAQALSSWHEHPHFDKWLGDQEALETKDPKAYAERGNTPGKLLDGVAKGQPAKAEPSSEKELGAGSQKNPTTEAAPKTEIRKRPAAKKDGQHLMTRLMEIYRDMKKNPTDAKLHAEADAIAKQLEGMKND